jgi:cob(I)alamin adenosyltransferase
MLTLAVSMARLSHVIAGRPFLQGSSIMTAYFHVYTGDGKGKTTAALGLALRAAGAGWNVFIGQFAKGQNTSELDALRRFGDQITVCQFGSEELIGQNPDVADIQRAARGLNECPTVLASGRYDLVILDEANFAAAIHLVSLPKLLELIDSRPEGVELVLTGRWAPPEILDRADLVTEMREIKHYYHQGVCARKGIEA